jgi:sensor domain CHASE-containing protein
LVFRAYVRTEVKKVLPIFMAFAILSHSLVQVGIHVYYQLNKQYITKQLCENRANPKMGCNGHCYLVKQLKKAEENEKKQSTQIAKAKEEIACNIQFKFSSNLNTTVEDCVFLAPSSHQYLADFNCETVKPPSA